MQNDDDVVDNAADVDVGVDLDVSAEATGIPAEAANEIAGDDELGEIDWRSGDVDGAEVGDADAEADEHASNASASGLQKRSHADDELDTADGKGQSHTNPPAQVPCSRQHLANQQADVKRQRS